ncbi:MAG: hypothetical protein K2P68_04070 [Sphingomonas sp.]|nr:hypothetical protein [Sphingomonas sp.]
MDPKYLSLVELLLSGAIGIGFCVWQYVSVSRSIAADKRKAADSPESAGHAVGEHHLDKG